MQLIDRRLQPFSPGIVHYTPYTPYIYTSIWISWRMSFRFCTKSVLGVQNGHCSWQLLFEPFVQRERLHSRDRHPLPSSCLLTGCGKPQIRRACTVQPILPPFYSVYMQYGPRTISKIAHADCDAYLRGPFSKLRHNALITRSTGTKRRRCTTVILV